jgi:hypothetical protein
MYLMRIIIFNITQFFIQNKHGRSKAVQRSFVPQEDGVSRLYIAVNLLFLET